MTLCREQNERSGFSFVFDWIKTQSTDTKRRYILKLIPSQIPLATQLNRSIHWSYGEKCQFDQEYKAHLPLTTLGGCDVVIKDTTSENGPAPASLLACIRNWYSVLSCSLLTLWDVEEPLNIVVKLKYDNSNWQWLSIKSPHHHEFTFAAKPFSDTPRTLKSFTLKI